MAAPVSPREASERALEWACVARGPVGWSSVGLLVPDLVTLDRARHLRQAQSKGAIIGSAQEPGDLAQWAGPLVVYWPTLATLAVAETMAATRTVVVALNNDTLRPWVDAFDPECLAGAPMPPTPVVLPVPLVRRAMVYYTHRFQREPAVPEPVWRMLLRRLEHLYHHGEHFTAESLLALAWQLHWPPDTAWELHQWATQSLPQADLPHPAP